MRNGLLRHLRGRRRQARHLGLLPRPRREHIDTTLVVDHAVPGCESRELFKGVLADKARGVFQGKVIVRPDAQKTDGKQMAQVLMLSRTPSSIPSPSSRSTPTTWYAATARPRPRSTRTCCSICARAASRRGGARAADRELRRRGARQGRGRALRAALMPCTRRLAGRRPVRRRARGGGGRI